MAESDRDDRKRGRAQEIEMILPDASELGEALRRNPRAARALLTLLVDVAHQEGVEVPWEHRDCKSREEAGG